MSQSSNRPRSITPVLGTLAVALGCIGHAHAIEGGAVVAGTGAIQTQRNTTTVNQGSDRMVVNWKNFDLARNQTVNFQQPGATSAVLNRVSGTGKATEILGSINANGRVFVVNPDGVMFGRTAKVDVGSLVASSLDTSVGEFMQGGRAFAGNARPGVALPRYVMLENGGAGAVRNEGRLTARDAIVLAGPEVENTGTLRATNVALHGAGGVGLLMTESGLDAVAATGRDDARVANSGSIVASGGNILMSAATTGELLRDVVRNTGTLEATKATVGRDGRIELQAPINGAIAIGGRVRAQGGVTAHASPMVYTYDMPAPQLEYDAPLATSGHDVRVESGARINAGGAVSLAAEDDVAVDGRIDGESVWLQGRDVTTRAPIHAVSNVNIDARGTLAQNGNIVADTAHVLLRANDIRQADGVTTRAGDYITLDATGAGVMQVANLNARQVDISGHDIVLQGDVRADGNIRVTASDERVCTQYCTTEFRQGSITQKGNVVSRDGDVTFRGYSTMTGPDGFISRVKSGVLTQAATAKTSAAGDVTVDMGKAAIGNLQAGRSIAVTTHDVTLTGRLVAPVITLPANAKNTEGNVRIRK